MAQPIPPNWSHLVTLNVEYSILICVDSKCKYALKPTAISRHLRDKHKVPSELQKQVDQYVQEFPFAYDHATVPLPSDGSAPQPIIPIVDGFLCKECPYKTRDHSNIRKHANQAHDKKRVADEDIFRAVRLQSWFGEKRERYWAVDESQQAQQERQAHRAAIQDAGEESCNNSEPNADGGSDGEDGQGKIDDQIIQEIENWKAEARERRLR